MSAYQPTPEQAQIIDAGAETGKPNTLKVAAQQVEFEVLLDLFLDGMCSGAASIIAHFNPTLSGSEVDQSARALLRSFPGDPLALESLRHHIRRRLDGHTTDDATEVRVYRSK
ncbi:hypothetical protein [Nocardia panacis]|nr:hypothetical protein [Nocardia panacis]